MIPEQYDPRFMKPVTQCRCGHILECCADCLGWLAEHSPRIAQAWRYYVGSFVGARNIMVSGQTSADSAESYYLAYYESQR